MKEYEVRFARVVIAQEFFTALSQEDAERIAIQMERRGELSILKSHPAASDMVLADNVVEIQDYEHIWEVEEVGGEPEPAFTTAFAVIGKEG